MSLPEQTQEHLRKLLNHPTDATVRNIAYYLEMGAAGEDLKLPGVSLDNLDDVREFLNREVSAKQAARDAKLATFNLRRLLEMLYDYAYENGQNSTYDGYVHDSREFSAEELNAEIAKRAGVGLDD